MFSTKKLVVLLLVTLLLASTGLVDARTRQHITYNAASEANGYDPRDCLGLNHRNVLNQVFEGLLKTDASGGYAPGMATSWDIIDDTTVVFHLRDGIKW